MNKIKIITLCVTIPFLIFVGSVLIKIKHKQEFQHKVGLAQQQLMLDLRGMRQRVLHEVPADGVWRHDDHLIEGDLGGLQMRRQQANPEILDVQIISSQDTSLVFNFKIRIL